MTALRVVLADDNYLVREGIRRLLVDDGDIDVVAGAANAPELLQLVRAHQPDAVLTDIRMPPTHSMEGIDAARQIRAELPKIGIVVLSQHADASYAQTLFADGTAGLAYLLKERVGDRDELIRALHAVAVGESVIDPHVVEALVSHRQHAQESLLDALSPRELDVLCLMAAGRTNAAIAAELYVSESAVSKHIAAIFGKLQLTENPSIDRRISAVLAYIAAPAPRRPTR